MRSGSLVSCITLFTCGLFLVAVDGRSTMREMPPTPPPIERIPRFHDTSDLTTRSMRAANAAGLNRRRSNPEAMHFGVARMTLTSNNQVPSNFSSFLTFSHLLGIMQGFVVIVSCFVSSNKRYPTCRYFSLL